MIRDLILENKRLQLQNAVLRLCEASVLVDVVTKEYFTEEARAQGINPGTITSPFEPKGRGNDILIEISKKCGLSLDDLIKELTNSLHFDADRSQIIKYFGAIEQR